VLVVCFAPCGAIPPSAPLSPSKCTAPLALARTAHIIAVTPSPQVIANSRSLGDALMAHGYKLVTNGTDNHLVLWDLRPEGITGSKMEKACDLCHITLNKNAVSIHCSVWVMSSACRLCALCAGCVGACG
jgi:glycine/serine hydroxymethyltransferase